MLVLSSASGAGKTTIARALLERNRDLALSVSATTRPPRPGEINGKDYAFVSTEAFARMLAERRFLEHASVFGNQYGTPREPVEAALAEGRDMLFDVDWQGARQLRDNAGADVVAVFVLPPSFRTLEHRLQSRGQDPAEVVRERMARAVDEISHWRDYDYVVINREVETAVVEVEAILVAERLRRQRQIGLAEFVAGLAPPA
jgi:guanylate kinase